MACFMLAFDKPSVMDTVPVSLFKASNNVVATLASVQRIHPYVLHDYASSLLSRGTEDNLLILLFNGAASPSTYFKLRTHYREEGAILRLLH